MKKITILLTTAFFVAGIGFAAEADSYNYKPYVGVDYTFNQTKAKGFNPHYHSAGLHIGTDYSKYFGTELFINHSNRAKNSATHGNIRTSNYNYGLDLYAYLPLFAAEKFSLLAGVGVGEYVYKTKFNPHHRWHEHGYGYRFAGGFKYAFDEHWQARAIARYINFDHLSGYKYAVEYSCGIEYHF